MEKKSESRNGNVMNGAALRDKLANKHSNLITAMKPNPPLMKPHAKKKKNRMKRSWRNGTFCKWRNLPIEFIHWRRVNNSDLTCTNDELRKCVSIIKQTHSKNDLIIELFSFVNNNFFSRHVRRHFFPFQFEFFFF